MAVLYSLCNLHPVPSSPRSHHIQRIASTRAFEHRNRLDLLEERAGRVLRPGEAQERCDHVASLVLVDLQPASDDLLKVSDRGGAKRAFVGKQLTRQSRTTNWRTDSRRLDGPKHRA